MHSWQFNFIIQSSEQRQIKISIYINLHNLVIIISKIRHNELPKALEDFFIKDQKDIIKWQIKSTNTIKNKYLKPIPIKDDQVYIYQWVNDSEKIGLRVKLDPRGTIVEILIHTIRKINNKKRFNSGYYTVRYFSDMTIDSTRYLVEDL